MAIEEHFLTFAGFILTAIGGYSRLLWSVSKRWDRQESALETLKELVSVNVKDLRERIEITRQTLEQVRAVPLHAHRIAELENAVAQIPEIQRTLATVVERIEDVKTHCRERHIAAVTPPSTRDLR